MTNRGAVRPDGGHSTRPGSRLARVLLGLLLVTLTGFSSGLPGATAAPHAPAPVATTSPTAAPSGQSPTAAPTSPSAPRPAPDDDRWIDLAVVGGGSLLGAVVVFMLIGGLIRWRNRRRSRY